jgi:hypothetical protein
MHIFDTFMEYVQSLGNTFKILTTSSGREFPEERSYTPLQEKGANNQDSPQPATAPINTF